MRLIEPLANLRCACGSPDIVCIDPGEPTLIDVATDIVTQHGRPVTARCAACWPTARGYQQELFAP